MADTNNTAVITAEERGKRKERVGEVISNKMTKTVVVRVMRRHPHAVFKKVVTSYSKFYAHDEKQEAKIGDRVRIIETRPITAYTLNASYKKSNRALVSFSLAGKSPAPGANVLCL